MKTKISLCAAFVIIPLFVNAGEIKILESNVTSETVTLMTTSDLKIGERDTVEEMRKQSLDQQKLYAMEYVGSYVQSQKTMEAIGDAALTRTKTLISTYSSGRVSSVILDEKNDGTTYSQTARLQVNLKSFLDEINRQKKISMIESRTKLEPKSEVESTDFTEAINSLKKQKEQESERKDYLKRFSLSLSDTQFITCSVGKISENSDGSAIAKYDCIFKPPSDYVENYKLYYKTDICDANVKKLAASGDDYPKKKTNIGSIAGSGFAYTFLALGSIIAAPIILELKGIEVMSNLFSKEDVPPYLDQVEMTDLDMTFDETATCRSNWIQSNIVLKGHVSVWGKSIGKLEIVNGGKILREASFKLVHHFSKFVDIRDVRANISIIPEMKNAEFAKGYSFR